MDNRLKHVNTCWWKNDDEAAHSSAVSCYLQGHCNHAGAEKRSLHTARAVKRHLLPSPHSSVMRAFLQRAQTETTNKCHICATRLCQQSSAKLHAQTPETRRQKKITAAQKHQERLRFVHSRLPLSHCWNHSSESHVAGLCVFESDICSRTFSSSPFSSSTA